MSDALVLEVIRKTVTVDCAVEEAFRVFTADAISWWPVETHSIHASVDEIVFEPRVGGAVYEIGTNGERGHWATVLEWEPPHRLVLAWNILALEESPTEVEVRFSPAGSGTRVDLELDVALQGTRDGAIHLRVLGSLAEGALVDADEADGLLHGRVRGHHLQGALHDEVAAQLEAGRLVLGEGQGAALGHPQLAGAGGGVQGDGPPLADGDGVAGSGHAATPGGGVGPGAGPGRLRVGLGRRREGEQQGERYRRSKP
jgi:uncharacterized protein YndB with AHSA1/START domain